MKMIDSEKVVSFLRLHLTNQILKYLAVSVHLERLNGTCTTHIFQISACPKSVSHFHSHIHAQPDDEHQTLAHTRTNTYTPTKTKYTFHCISKNDQIVPFSSKMDIEHITKLK